MGGKALGFALVLDNDRPAASFLHSSGQAINLSVPASLEIAALRLRKGKEVWVFNSQKCSFLTFRLTRNVVQASD